MIQLSAGRIYHTNPMTHWRSSVDSFQTLGSLVQVSGMTCGDDDGLIDSNTDVEICRTEIFWMNGLISVPKAIDACLNRFSRTIFH